MRKGELNAGLVGLAAFAQASVLALGIQPYINASIIIQLLTVAIPALERMAKEEGEEGKKKIERITRYSTAVLGLLLAAYLTGVGAVSSISPISLLVYLGLWFVPSWLITGWVDQY